MSSHRPSIQVQGQCRARGQAFRCRLGALSLLVAAACGCGGGSGNPFQPDGQPPADATGDVSGDGRDVRFGGLFDVAADADAAEDLGPPEDMISVPDLNTDVDPRLCPMPISAEYGDEEVCGDGLDNDGDGQADEGCPCAAGSVQRCFLGPPARRGVGACSDGQQVCVRAGKGGIWGPCQGAIGPQPESCDSLDNDCNGCIDEDPSCVENELICPAPDDPRLTTLPLTEYPLRGSDFYTGEASAWRWEVACPSSPCASLTGAQKSCPAPADPNAQDTSVFLALSGDYTVTLTITTPDGDIGCTFVVRAAGPGLRVEMCWDTTGRTDMDLHLHRPASTAPWFDCADDCYYANCKAEPFPTPPFADCNAPASWGYPDTDLANCQGGPEGDQWQDVGACRNPRLDIDNFLPEQVGIPENINVDNPAEGDVFRVAVNYFRGCEPGFFGPDVCFDSHPIVNVYCGGVLKSSFGVAPDVATMSANNIQQQGPSGQLWRVADVRTLVDAAGVTTDCEVTPINPPGTTSGYYITRNDLAY